MLIRNELLSIARTVLEEQYLKAQPSNTSRKLIGYCGVASALVETLGLGRLAYGQVWLSWELKKPGFAVAQHCWIVSGDDIIDLTATQFEGPSIHIGRIGENPKWGEYIETAPTNFLEWPEWQQPLTQLIQELKEEVLRRVKLGDPQFNHSLWA